MMKNILGRKNQTEQPEQKDGAPTGSGVLYLGEDQGYWQDIQEGFKAYKQLSFNFITQKDFTHDERNNLVKTIHNLKPRVIFVDLSKDSLQQMRLMRLLARKNAILRPFVVALIDYTQDRELLRQAVAEGIQCAHVKSSEIEAVIYDCICFAFHNSLEALGFAVAKMSDEVMAFAPARVSLATSKGFRVESNHKMAPGELTLLRSHWSEKNIINTRMVSPGQPESRGLYSSFRNAQELKIEYEPFEMPEMATDEEVQKLKNEHEQAILESKNALSEWIKKYKSQSKPKFLKTLVIDKEFALYEGNPESDSYPFSLRVQPFLMAPKRELTHYLPQLIGFHLEEVEEEELQANQDVRYSFNDEDSLAGLIKTIKSIGDYAPFVVVFNSPRSTKELQAALNYPQIIGHSEALGPEVFLKMAQILQKKMDSSESAHGEDMLVINRGMPGIYAEYETTISLVACSETDVYFNSEYEYQVGDVLRLESPVSMFITVAEPPPRAKVPGGYYAIIHGVGEDTKKDLRRFINSVFFRAKEAAKQKELEEIENAKERYLKEQKELLEGKSED